jgi:hypothetical protein
MAYLLDANVFIAAKNLHHEMAQTERARFILGPRP